MTLTGRGQCVTIEEIRDLQRVVDEREAAI